MRNNLAVHKRFTPGKHLGACDIVEPFSPEKTNQAEHPFECVLERGHQDNPNDRQMKPQAENRR